MAAGRRSTTTARPRDVEAPRGQAAPEHGMEPAFQRAILKIALELKKPTSPGYDAIVEQTIRNMRLDPAAFRRYLGENGARNMSLLLATARGPGL
jgi:hypothetical protein